jgi:hypothetical protein
LHSKLKSRARQDKRSNKAARLICMPGSGVRRELLPVQ